MYCEPSLLHYLLHYRSRLMLLLMMMMMMMMMMTKIIIQITEMAFVAYFKVQGN